MENLYLLEFSLGFITTLYSDSGRYHYCISFPSITTLEVPPETTSLTVDTREEFQVVEGFHSVSREALAKRRPLLTGLTLFLSLFVYYFDNYILILCRQFKLNRDPSRLYNLGRRCSKNATKSSNVLLEVAY
jgi:hypothetical protein